MSVLKEIGNTPLIPIEGIWVKLECSNPSGSVKDRIAKFLLEEAMQSGKLAPGDTVVEATSGNTGIGISMVARELGLNVIIYMPEHMSQERQEFIRSLGADLRLTPEEESFAGSVAYRDRHLGEPGYFIPDQFGNPDNPKCHRLTTGTEMLRQLQVLGAGELDALVAGTGTGGTLMGVGEALREAMPKIKIVAVEPSESAVMSGCEPGDHFIQGIGDGFIPSIVDMEFVDRVETVSSEEARGESSRLHEEHGYCVGISAGANTLVAKRLRDEGLKVVTLWPDCSDRYETLGLAEPDDVEESRCPWRATCAVHREMIGTS